MSESFHSAVQQFILRERWRSTAEADSSTSFRIDKMSILISITTYRSGAWRKLVALPSGRAMCVWTLLVTCRNKQIFKFSNFRSFAFRKLWVQCIFLNSDNGYRHITIWYSRGARPSVTTLPNEAMSLKGKQLGTLSCVPAEFWTVDFWSCWWSLLMIFVFFKSIQRIWPIFSTRCSTGDLGYLKAWTRPPRYQFTSKNHQQCVWGATHWLVSTVDRLRAGLELVTGHSGV